MTPYRVHFLAFFIARCGIDPKNWTIYSAKVTCKTCKRLLEKEVK